MSQNVNASAFRKESEYIKYETLKGSEYQLEISGIEQGEFIDQTTKEKTPTLTLLFKDTDKKLTLGQINLATMIDTCGEMTAQWVGRSVLLRPEIRKFGANERKMVILGFPMQRVSGLPGKAAATAPTPASQQTIEVGATKTGFSHNDDEPPF